MKDIKVYDERMSRSFTPDEKLFFMNPNQQGWDANLWKYETIVDFGCGDGTMMQHISDHLAESCRNAPRHVRSPLIVGVERRYRQKEHGYTEVRCLKDLELRSSQSPTLLILSSVLHELNSDEVEEIVDFCNNHNVDVIIRDMLWDYGNHESQSVLDGIIEALPRSEQDKLTQIEDRMVIYDEDLPHMVGDLTTATLYEYFLKYTYLENWESEKLEWYFCNNAWQLRNTLCAYKRWKPVYERKYTLPYKEQEIAENFGYVMRFPTHFQTILVKEKK